MSEGTDGDTHEFIKEQFSSRREILEALAEFDNELSEDAERILQILDEDNQE